MDPLVIQAMKNRSAPIREFNKKEDVNRIYGHRPLQRYNNVDDDNDMQPFDVILHDGRTQKERETDEMLQRVREKKHAEKLKDEEEELRIAQKIHRFTIEEMETERERLEKLLEEKKKQLLESDAANIAPKAPSPVPSAVSKVVDVKEENEENDQINCVVCMDAKREILCMPCLHVALCLECSKTLKQCPVCMGQAEMKRIFLA